MFGYQLTKNGYKHILVKEFHIWSKLEIGTELNYIHKFCPRIVPIIQAAIVPETLTTKETKRKDNNGKVRYYELPTTKL